MKKTARLLVFAAWIMHGIAWLLPAVTSAAGDALSPGILGFEAFGVAASAALHLSGPYFDAWYGELLGDISVIGTVLFVVLSLAVDATLQPIPTSIRVDCHRSIPREFLLVHFCSQRKIWPWNRLLPVVFLLLAAGSRTLQPGWKASRTGSTNAAHTK